MKAYRITSTEYRANAPSVMLFIDGKYYGETSYAMRDGFPKDIEHWKYAECSDAGRKFKVEEIECPEFVLSWLEKMNEKIVYYKRCITINEAWKEQMQDKVWLTMQAELELIKRL